MTTGAYMTTAAWGWPATGTTWQIHHSGGVAQATAAAVASAVAADERRWSRFLADSDVSRLNAAAGSEVEVSQETLDLLDACDGWVRRTDGVFQPLIGRTLAAWGYDRSLADHRPHAASSPPRRAVRGAVTIDRGRGRARVPAGTWLDLGGIAKGWMAGRAAHARCARCPTTRRCSSTPAATWSRCAATTWSTSKLRSALVHRRSPACGWPKGRAWRRPGSTGARGATATGGSRTT